MIAVAMSFSSVSVIGRFGSYSRARLIPAISAVASM
jgi:hypothetical protein